ncbi:hypothetical protein, partial [Amycolatopsis sp. NPDC059021]|uniref:hypothetical protein n=1 Tax=Amycolatopsis sp. NPDC059021 TaxID=3346704 RepID=UPI003673542D
MTTTVDSGRQDTAPPELSRKRVNAVFAAVMLGMLLAALDQTMGGAPRPPKRGGTRGGRPPGGGVNAD